MRGVKPVGILTKVLGTLYFVTLSPLCLIVVTLSSCSHFLQVMCLQLLDPPLWNQETDSSLLLRLDLKLFDEALVFPVLSPSPHPAPPSRKPPLPAGGLFPVKMEFILSTLTSVARLIVVFSAVGPVSLCSTHM